MSNLAIKPVEWINKNIDKNNLKDSQEQLNLIHSEDDGFITMVIKDHGKWNQYHYKIEDLNHDTLNYFLSADKDTYMSINSFYAPIRKAECVRKINALFLDLDNHNFKMDKHCLDSALYFLENDYFNKIIPEPSLIVATGRGLQLYFKIENLPKQALPLWQMVQNEMIDKMQAFDYQGFEIDGSCTDVSRVFRLCGSLNTKSNTRAKIIDINSNCYRLDELIQDYFESLQITKKKTKKNKTLKEKKVLNLYTLYSLHYARLNDIVKLQSLRGGECKGNREFMCFLYRYYSILYIKDYDRALQDTLDFNQGFTEPLKENEVIKQTKSAEKAFEEWLKEEKNGVYKRGGYNYTNATLIRKLSITESEQKELSTIIGKEEKNRRKNIANKEMYKKARRNENGLTNREQQKQDTIRAIQELKAQGLSQSKVSKELGKGIATIKRYWNI